MKDIASFFYQHNKKQNRNGWYLQQLLKLYASFVIKDLLNDYLVIDADVYFLKPINSLLKINIYLQYQMNIINLIFIICYDYIHYLKNK
jgi:hypothetical protein